MLNHALTALTLSLTLALTAGMVGCAADNRRSEHQGAMASTNPQNGSCPLCGARADTEYTVSHNGSRADCCSQACCDKFNSATETSKRDWMRNANTGAASADRGYGSRSAGDAQVSPFPASAGTKYSNPSRPMPSDRGSTTSSNRGGTNRTCPITGKAASDRYTFVDADGTVIAFSSQEAADQYMSYGPEHRAEVRSHMRQ